MRLVADLHVHSRYSRATSREADLDGFHRWAQVKGISIIGTGDFTHPQWFAELSSRLVEKDGLYVLKDPPTAGALDGVSPAALPLRFMLTSEISSIYKKHGAVRKVHSLVVMPSLEAVARLNAKLATIGNIHSDGRPILGLDPKDLLSLVLDIAPDGFLIPAHIWTPWFSVFGSKSGFDRIEDCFEELTPHIFALETGLSSDPSMNWRWSALDRYRLVSNSDAHSPPNLGREANALDTEPTWDGVVGALRTGEGFVGTIEFYPEEGKYHFDGHRTCRVCMDPEETLRSGGLCPVCGKPVTVGVLNRVLGLADRPSPVRPAEAAGFRSIIPLPELLAECAGVGPGSQAVTGLYARLIGAFGNEFSFLLDAPVEDIERAQGVLLAEAVRRMRAGRVDPKPGYDGKFGVIRVFDEPELERLRGQDQLFAPSARPRARKERAGLRPGTVRAAAGVAPEAGAGLDPDQEAIVATALPRSLVFAGPGSGKTRLLAAWVVRAALRLHSPESRVLALTFTNRAADELSQRVSALLPHAASLVMTATFHSLAWSLLRERFPELHVVLTASDRDALLQALLPDATVSVRRTMGQRMERWWEGMEAADPELDRIRTAYEEETRRIGGVDVSALVPALNALLDAEPGFLSLLKARHPFVAIDELQDINSPQFALLSKLASSQVLGIGDPDQAIYGFRGSDRSLFFRFREETGTATFNLTRNYRSSGTIVASADAIIASDRADGSPALSAVRADGARIRIAAAANPEEEGRLIASAITDLVGGVDAVSVDAARVRGPGAMAFSDIAVLFRTRAVRDALLPALSAAGLPLALGTGAPLSDEEPFRSLIAALRLVANPSDTVALAVMSAHAAGADALLRGAPELSRVAAELGVCALIDRVVDGFVPIDRTVPEAALGEETLRASAAEHGTDLDGFLGRVSLCARETEPARPAEKVSLLTFHAAKGLEWPVVFIAGAEEGITPMGEDLSEERRLFYVAVTRARDHLHITHCRSRRVFGRETAMTPSRYLAEIPARCRQEESARRAARPRQLTLF